MDEELSELKQQQAFLAKSLTDPLLQTQLSHFPWSPIAPEHILEHRETLIRKRIQQTSHMLPHTTRTLGDQFVPIYREFANQQHFNSVAAIRQDAIHFTRWLEQRSFPMPWLTCCCWLERTRCEWENAKSFYCKFKILKYDFYDWEPTAEYPNKKATAWFFLNSGLSHLAWHWPKRKLSR